MANEVVQLNEQTMEEAALKIKNSAEEIKISLDIIKSTIQGIEDVWNDKNAKVFTEKFQDFQQNFPKFYQHTYAFGSFLDGVVKAYRENVINPTARAVNGSDNNKY